MSKIFKDAAAKRMFSKLYHSLMPQQQNEFGTRLRILADEKITRLDDIDDFYINEDEVIDIYNNIS